MRLNTAQDVDAEAAGSLMVSSCAGIQCSRAGSFSRDLEHDQLIRNGRRGISTRTAGQRGSDQQPEGLEVELSLHSLSADRELTFSTRGVSLVLKNQIMVAVMASDFLPKIMS